MDSGANLPSGLFNVANRAGQKLADTEPGEKVTEIVFDRESCYDTGSGMFISLLVCICIVVGLQKSSCMKKIFHVVPESGCLVITGFLISFVLVGVRLRLWDGIDQFAPDVQALLIPIILHASYSLFHPHFFGQLGTILIFAFIGTFMNVLGISLIIHFPSSQLYPGFNVYNSLTFASLISAVDPVAVLAVFKEVNADKRLHYLIFGESLLNDGVTYVLYEGFKKLTDPAFEYSNVPLMTYVYITGSFITAPLGGILIGFVLGVFSVFHYRFTTRHRTAMLIYAFFSFLLADIFGFSSIISLITYGLTQERYAFVNMDMKDQINSNNIVHGFATVFEAILFLLLGFEVLNHYEDFKKYYVFCLISLLACVVVRFLVIFILVSILNYFRNEPIDLKWQAIILLGGLRGVVAYAMVVDYNDPEFQSMFRVATIFNIVLTNVLNGTLTKPLVLYFDLRQGDIIDYAEFYKDKKRNWIFRAFKWLETECILVLVPGTARNPETKEADDEAEENVMDNI